MNDDRELKKTFGFLIGSVVLVAVAALMGWASKPPAPSEFSDIGEPFYADFEDPSEATRLRLASWNDELAKVDVFEVKFTPESGWTIPSHNDYPADGEEQLAKTAASIVDIERGGLMPGRKESHARYGVVDPLDETATGTEGRGSRLTLWDGDTVLADYVIGKKVADEDDVSTEGEALYYVRKAGEDGEERVYRASLDIDISTDFSDWIEPDLLQLGSVSDLRLMVVDRYQVDEQTGRVTEGDKSRISRASATDSWALEGLDEKTETLETSVVSKMTTSLDDLEIIGVRKKPAILTAQLKRQEMKGFSNFDVMRMQADLEQKGFFLDPNGVLISNEGDFTAGIDEGILYTLRFGEVFSGSKAKLEVGGEESTDEESADDASKDESDTEDESTDDASNDDTSDDEDDETLRGRYVFITVAFDESLLTPVGDAPVKPEPPKKEAAEEETTEEEAATEDADAADDSADKKEAEAEEDTSDEAESDDPEYKAALERYEIELEEYERKKKEFDRKVEEGKERVQELSDRFADWYYVISADTFDNLAVSRDDLVEPKETEEESTEPATTNPPALPTPDKDAGDKVEPVMESLKPGAASGEKEKGTETEKNGKADDKVEPVMESVGKKQADEAAKEATPKEKPADAKPKPPESKPPEKANEPRAASEPESAGSTDPE